MYLSIKNNKQTFFLPPLYLNQTILLEISFLTLELFPKDQNPLYDRIYFLELPTC